MEKGYNYMQNSADIGSEVTRAELDIIKSEMHERSMQSGHIEYIGTLGAEGSKLNWTGGISLSRRLEPKDPTQDNRHEDEKLTSQEVGEALNFIPACYVPTQQGAYIRCIDGRIKIGYSDYDPTSVGQKLGPQVAGGTPIQALTFRVSSGGNSNDFKNTSLRKDTDFVSLKVNNLGFLPGDHVDENHKPGKTGCGAVDGCEEHCEAIGPQTLEEVELMTSGVLGEYFNPEHFDSNIASFSRLLANKEAYFAEKNAIIAEFVEHNPEAAPVLTGRHNEIAVIINLVKGETFHTDHFASQFEGRIQAFNYDIWHTFEIAEELFPDDQQKQSKYVHGRMMLAVTALMGLTDGSLIVGVRRPIENENATAESALQAA
jgi:hypothetical protein